MIDAGLDLTPKLRDCLDAADYTVDAVAEMLGETAHRALERNETTPGLRASADGSPLATLTRLFLLQTPVGLEDAERALPGLVDPLCNIGLLEQSVSEVAARLDCRPYATEGADLWVVSDLTPGLDGAPNQVGGDHVLGISAASTSLAQLTVRHPVNSALDLGTGCGVQALHLAEHARSVVATDVNQRALAIARFNAALNALPGIEVRDGSFFEPVRGETFDLIATNPPFVISPATGERLVYRDSGLPGDRVVEDIVRGAPALLNEQGWCQILANWAIMRDLDWSERLAGWLPHDAECDALVVQREVLDTCSYVELWLKDAGQHGAADYAHRYDTWMSWFDAQGIEAVGFGWINLHRTGGQERDLFEWPYDVEQPIAPAIGQWADALAASRAHDDSALLAAHLVARNDILQETQGQPGAADPATVVLRQQRGFRRARQADTVTAALLGACDGELTVAQILDALASLLETDAVELRRAQLPVVRELALAGFLTW